MNKVKLPTDDDAVIKYAIENKAYDMVLYAMENNGFEFRKGVSNMYFFYLCKINDMNFDYKIVENKILKFKENNEQYIKK